MSRTRQLLAAAAPQQVAERRAGGERLEAAAVAAAADRAAAGRRARGRSRRPCRRAPRYGRPSTIRPGADAGRRSSGRRRRGRRAPAPSVTSASAPRLASLSRWTGRSPSRRLISAAASSPSQPGRIAVGRTAPRSWSIGPEQPMPTPSTSVAVDAGLGEQLVDELGGGVERVLGVVVDVAQARIASASTVRERSETATRMWSWPKSMPTTAPAERSSESSVGGRPGGHAGRGVRVRALDDEPVAPAGRRRGSRPSSGDRPVTARDLGTACRPAARAGRRRRAGG